MRQVLICVNTDCQQHPALQFIWTLEFKQTAMHKVLQTESPNARLSGTEFKVSLQFQAMLEKTSQREVNDKERAAIIHRLLLLF